MATQALFDIGNVFLAPAPTFTRLKEKTHAWLPLLVSILLSLAVMVWWIDTLDFDWLRQHMLSAQPDARPEVRDAMMHALTPQVMMWSSGVGAVIGTLLALTVSALYYLLAGKVVGTSIGYGKWFGFAVWTNVPQLLIAPLSMLQILTSHGHLAPEDLNMVSLNYLLFHLPLSHPWANLAGSIGLTSFWTIALAVVGLKAWTGRPTGTCVTMALLPQVVMYTLWAAKIAFLG